MREMLLRIFKTKGSGQTKKFHRFIAYGFGYFDSNFFKKQSDFIFTVEIGDLKQVNLIK